MTSLMRPQHGVTLIELLVSLTILAILLGIAVPSFQAMIAQNRLDSHANSVFSTLLLARSEAIKRNKRVVVCKSSNGTSCTGNWNQGWIVFVDTNNDAAVSPGENILLTLGALPTNYSLSGNTQIANYVSYNTEGMTRSTSGSLQSGTFSLCPPAPAPDSKGRNIVISTTGKPRIEEKTDCS